ncbi:MAG TPA: thiamine pyrophosphate-requiring protein [Kofleriaceae bacterium]|nr:thiamine pyrophosphate-requiring protein [Kofleriaceae bacterium]
MAQTVSDHIIQRLYAWGVRTIYGYPGDGINGLIGAIERAEGRVRFIQPRHEESAAFMACGHAKFTGEVGVCMATSGPGAIHLLNGLYDAQMDHQPVVAIVGQSARTAIGADYQQEVDLGSLFKDVAHHYVHACTHPAAARHQIDRAMRIAFAERTVTCVIVPHDVQELDAIESPPHEHDVTLSGVGYHRGVVVPAAYDLQAAADVLNRGEKVAILVGAGALGATEELVTVAETLGAGVAKALLGKAVLPDNLPFVTGAIGLLGTEPSDKMMQRCDTLFMIGSSFPYIEFLPKEGQARGVQIDIAPRMLSLRYPMEVSLHGDTAETLRVLLPLLQRKTDRRWRADIEGWVADWWRVMEARAMEPAEPINPQRVFWELSPRLPDHAILTADSGSCAGWWARDLQIRPGMMASLSGNLATMGPAMPYAAAAKFAHPDRPVIAAVGDGAMQMIGNNVLVTISAHYKEWPDPRLIVIVLNNGDLNMVTWEQRIIAGDPKFNASQNLPAFPYAKYAQMLGLVGLEVQTPEQIAPALDQALAADRPVVIDCHVDPEVPPLPPHISFKQAKNFMSSVLHGDPHRWRMIQQSARQVWAGIAAK